MPAYGMAKFVDGKSSIFPFCLWLCLLSLLCLPRAVDAKSTKLDQAREAYDRARTAHTSLDSTPAEKRTEKAYADLIDSFRRVYLTAPTYGNNTICMMVIGELAEEAARRFARPAYFQTAIDSYELLRKSYPQSQFRFEALLSIARIYREDLAQPSKALEQYERYLKT